MHKNLRHAAVHAIFAALLGAATVTSAQAGVLTYQGVTFTSTWSGNLLTLEIDAAKRSGDWSAATGLAALGIKGIGNYTGVSVTATPDGASSWKTTGTELRASGCSGTATGAAGSRLCFSGKQIALADNMVFTFAFTGANVTSADPHVKVEFVNASGTKTGSLLSQTLLPSTDTGTGSGSGSESGGGSPTTPTTPVTPVIPTTPSQGESSGGGPDNKPALPPAGDLPTTIPVDLPVQTGGNEVPHDKPSADVPEPQSVALLLGGLGLMGLVLRRRKHGKQA